MGGDTSKRRRKSLPIALPCLASPPQRKHSPPPDPDCYTSSLLLSGMAASLLHLPLRTCLPVYPTYPTYSTVAPERRGTGWACAWLGHGMGTILRTEGGTLSSNSPIERTHAPISYVPGYAI